jgi:hypothetical protein
MRIATPRSVEKLSEWSVVLLRCETAGQRHRRTGGAADLGEATALKYDVAP